MEVPRSSYTSTWHNCGMGSAAPTHLWSNNTSTYEPMRVLDPNRPQRGRGALVAEGGSRQLRLPVNLDAAAHRDAAAVGITRREQHYPLDSFGPRLLSAGGRPVA